MGKKLGAANTASYVKAQSINLLRVSQTSKNVKKNKLKLSQMLIDAHRWIDVL